MNLVKKYKPLSAVMAGVLVDIIDHGGIVVRHQGGFWSYPGCTRNNGRLDWYCGTTTIEALVARGDLVYTEWKEGRRGKFPIRAQRLEDALIDNGERFLDAMAK